MGVALGGGRDEYGFATPTNIQSSVTYLKPVWGFNISAVVTSTSGR